MKSLFTPLVFAALAGYAACSPVAEPAITETPSLANRATSCIFSGSTGASKASVSQKSCSSIILTAVAVPSGTTLDLSDLEDDTTIIFEGETTWGYEEWDGPLLQISGTGITVKGASGAYLNPNGARWWDGEGSNGGKTKAKFFYAHDVISSTITDLIHREYAGPGHMTINNEAGDSEGHNTDGFDIGDSTNVVITGANVYNQDDCVAVNSGTDITFSGGVCSGGHGPSIGSVGGRSDNIVDTVTFENCEVKSSVNGIRIKAIEGDTGEIKGVTYSEITLSDITGYGILIEQNYDSGDLDGGTPTSGIPITNLTIENISGSDAVSSSGYNTVIVCGSSGCSDWTWSDVDVSGGKTYSDCENVPSVASCS